MENIKNIQTTTEKTEMNRNTESHLEKLRLKLTNLSNRTIFIFSALTSGYMSYKYLKNKEVYTEYNGHFNSPNNLLNKRMTLFHLQEAVMRFSLGIVFIGGFTLVFTRIILTNLNKENNMINKDDNINTKMSDINNEDEDEDIITNKNIIPLNDYQMNEEKAYDVNGTLERKSRVDNYLSKRNNNSN